MCKIMNDILCMNKMTLCVHKLGFRLNLETAKPKSYKLKLYYINLLVFFNYISLESLASKAIVYAGWKFLRVVVHALDWEKLTYVSMFLHMKI